VHKYFEYVCFIFASCLLHRVNGVLLHNNVQGGSSANGKDTMSAVNPWYQGNMGQRTGLSFENIKAINMAYCADRCSRSSLARPCQHSGYQDPNDCTRCICPDGFGGPYCDQIATPTHGQLSIIAAISHLTTGSGVVR